MNQKLKYYVQSVNVKISVPLFLVARKILDIVCERDIYEGITILHLPARDSDYDDPLFISKTKEALQLLLELDERRYRRVQKEIPAIIRSHQSHYVAHYQRAMKLCLINFRHLPYKKCEDLATKIYICTLVYNATWGHINSQGIETVKMYRKRIEKLCALEEYRMACKFKDGHSDLWERIYRDRLNKGFRNWKILLEG